MGKWSRPKAVWDTQNTDIFCQLCVKEIDAGHRPGTHFEKEGWQNLVENFERTTGYKYDKVQLKNKWDNLKEIWKLWKQLKGSETGLGWDTKKKTIDASEEWWKKNIEVNQEYKRFRDKGIDPEFEDTLDRMFSDVVATGKFEFAPSIGMFTSHMEVNELHDSESESDEDVMFEATQNSAYNDGDTSLKMKKKTDLSKSKIKKKYRKDGRGKIGGAQKMAQQIERLCTAVEARRNSSMANEKNNGVSITEAMEQLDAIPGIEFEAEAYLCATRLFMDKDKREMFVCLKTPELKLAWIKNEQSLGL